MKFDEKSNFGLNPPFFISMATAAKFVQPIAIFLVYLIQLDVDVTGNITVKLCEVGSEFNIFCTLVTMAMTAILNLFFMKPCRNIICHVKLCW
jgi:hypothetical protein